YAPPQYAPPQSIPPQYAPPPYEPAPPRATPDFSGPARTGANWSPPYTANDTSAKLTHAAALRSSAATRSAPGPVQVAAPTPTSTSMAGASAQTLLPAPPVHTVVSGDTLGRVAHRYRVNVKDLAVANGIAPETPLKIGMQLTVPVKTPPSIRPGKPQLGAPLLGQTKPNTAPYANTPAAPVPGKLASSEAAANVRIATPVEAPSEDAGPNGSNGAPAFRWPARGRVINNF